MKVELTDITTNAELFIAEQAGICYDSTVTKPNQLLKRLKADGHLATFRFANASFKVTEISRACSMQLLRHAFISVLQRSQRYCKEDNAGFVTPPSIEADSEAWKCFNLAINDAQYAYDRLIGLGIRAEDARYVLPNATHTQMALTGNLQAFYDLLYGNAGRLQKAAQWEVREVAIEIEKILHQECPNIFGLTNGE